jgi:predicted transcriptional regulator YdeE
MDVTLMNRDGFTVLGVLNRIDPMHTDYQAIWHKQVMPRQAEFAALAGEEGVMAAVFFPTDAPPPLVDMIAGMMVPAATAAPEGLTLRQVPAGCYAVVDTPLRDIAAAWGFLYEVWQGTTDYVIDSSKPSYEYYPPSPADEMRAMVCVPVLAKERG